MFFAEDRIKAVREMICARTVEEREAALAKVEPFQQGDFEAMYRRNSESRSRKLPWTSLTACLLSSQKPFLMQP